MNVSETGRSDVPPRTSGGGFRFPPERRHLLQSEDRRQWLRPDLILREAAVTGGEVAADVGAGTGFWTVPLAELVGANGKVFAIDVEPLMHDDLKSLVTTLHLSNVEIVASEEHVIPLPGACADVAVMGFVLHEPPEPPELVAEVKRLLKPGGRILVIDWHKWPTEDGPPVEHRVDQHSARALLEAAGFETRDIKAPADEVYVFLGLLKPAG